MELLVIVCSSTMQGDVHSFFERNGIDNFTKIPEVTGSGKGGGTRLNDEIWPGVNTLFLVAAGPGPAAALKAWVRQYRQEEVREGLKLFSLALQELI